MKKYNDLMPHEQRVVNEREELVIKSVALDGFITGEIFKTLSRKNQYLLKKQLLVIQMYIDILDLRISFFYDEGEEAFSHGENMIGSFGTDTNFDVFTLKCLASEFINQTNLKGKESNGRNKSIAATNMEIAQMHAVKSLF